MKNADAVSALAALAQENRLDVFRLLVQAGPEGLSAGACRVALKLAPNTLTFHFDRLRDAGLVTVRREGRSMIYAARFKVMNHCSTSLPRIAAKARRKSVRLRSANQSGATRQETRNGALMRLYMFEHCSLCFRVRMTAALKRLHFKKSLCLMTTPTPWSVS